MSTKIVSQLSNYLDQHGELKRDLNHNRNTLELVCCVVTLTKDDMLETISTVPYNSKYDPEVKDFDDWYYKCNFSAKERRQVIYFNNTDFAIRMQCISTIQVIDEKMLVYQRSGDISKMADDHRFFCHLKANYFTNVTTIHVIYGSLHKETKVIGNRTDNN